MQTKVILIYKDYVFATTSKNITFGNKKVIVKKITGKKRSGKKCK